MFSLRTAQGRAILAGVVLVLVLAAVATVAILRVRLHQDRLLALESTATSVAALEHARAQFFLETAATSALIFTQDPVLAERYEAAAAALRLDLSRARAEMIASGKADDLAALDKLTEQIDALEATIDGAIPVLLAGDQEEVLALANIAYLELWPSIDSAANDLEALANAEQDELAAARVEADRAVKVTNWIVVGFSGGALLTAAGILIAVIASMVRPLASLRASARTITSGDLKARAKVAGPEEVASLARSFNEMTDALSAKTQEYIDTTNLTGDLIGKLDKHGRWAFLNDAACQFYGKPREELLGTDSRASVHPDDLKPTARRIRETAAGKELHKGFVNRQLTPMGTRVVEWNGYPLFDEEGEYAGIQITGRDITDRKQAKEALRESTERLLTAQRVGKIGFFDWNLRTKDLYWSDQVYDLYGIDKGEYPTDFESALQLVHPDDRALVRENIEKALTGEKPYDFDHRVLRPDGNVMWVHAQMEVVRDAKGKPERMMGTVVDITERKQAEEALASSEDRLRILFEFAPDAYYLNDFQGNLVDGNRAAEELTGYKREELVGKSFLDLNLLPPEQLQKAAANLPKILQGLPSGPDEFTLNRKDGGQVPVEIRTFAVKIGEQALALGIARDITERKRAEAALRETEERFRTVSELTSDYICRISIDSENNMAVEMVSAGFTRISGFPVDDVNTPSKWRKAFHPDDLDKFADFLKHVISKRQGETEIRGLTKTGEIRWLHVYGQAQWDDNEQRVCGAILAAKDVTERKQAEEALQSSEERLRILFEFAPEAHYLHDLKGNFVDGNRAAAALTGYTREELIGKNLLKSNLLPPEQLPRAAATVAKLVQGALAGPDEFTLIRKDGKHVSVETRGFPVKIGSQTLILGIGRDISERKRAEEALQESEARYRLLAENASDTIWTMDLGLRYTYMSPAVTRMRGFTVEEVMGGTLAETLTPASLDLARKTLAEELAMERVEQKDLHRSRTLELEMHCKDGSTIWTEVIVTFLRDPDGQAVGILGATRDIAERKRAEEALQESETRYRNLFESTHDMIQSVAPDGRLLFANQVWLKTLGYTETELPGLSLFDIIHPESLSHCQELFARVMAGESADHVEATFVAKDGRPIAVEGHVSARRVGGEVVATHGFFRDVTEHKKAEEERERLNTELELRAITDSLTGLYDHAHFYQRLVEEIERSKRYKHGFALLMMDVDDFKRFNDSRGHQVGDEMLRLVADCIPAGLRRSDIAFRYGGDEFAAILPHADTKKAGAAVDRMNRHIVKRLNQMDGDPTTRLTLTAGVACFPDDGATADELVRIADAALYNAKWVARARDIMGQREDVQSLVSTLVSRQGEAEGSAGETVFRPEALHEQQARIVSSVASSIAVALKDAGVAQALEDPDLQVLATVGAAAEIKDRYIRGHPERMSEWAVALAEEMGLSPERVRDIRIAALLHDIGKVTVSEGILNKPGKLTRREFASIKDHPIVGATLVSQVKDFERLAKIVRHHHERFDGSGYPDGLAGEDIPPESRILSVLDVFDALTHQRSYRKAQSKEEALAEIERGAGTQFDPMVAKAFLALVRRRGDGLRAPAQTASEDRPLVAARAAGRRKR